MKYDSKYISKLIFVNSITLLRIVGMIVIALMINKVSMFKLGIVVLIFLLTDSIDGFLSRKLEVSTFFGAILDGVSDKLFMFVVLFMIGSRLRYVYLLFILELIIFVISYVGIKRGHHQGTLLIGKVKMVVMSLFVVLAFLMVDYNYDSLLIVLFSITMIMEIVTVISYLLRELKDTTRKSIKKYKKDDRKVILDKLFSHDFYVKNKDKTIRELIYS